MPIPTSCLQSPHVLWMLLLKQGPKSAAAATAPELALPSRSRCHCHSFIFGDDGSRKPHSPVSIIWQPSPALSPPSSPEGAADQGGPGCREAAGPLCLAGVEGRGMWLHGARGQDGIERGVRLLSLGKRGSRQGYQEKMRGETHGGGGEKKRRNEICVPCQASTAP